MAIIKGTLFSDVYESFLSKITDDMYMQLTPEDTYQILRELLLSSIHKFEFPRQSLKYELIKTQKEDNTIILKWCFVNKLTHQEINILSSYMIVQWVGQQLASIQNTRMKYSGSDFKFTSQANHIQKLLQLKKDYEREGFHLQRLYKRRKADKHGIYRSTFASIMEKPIYQNTNSVDKIKLKQTIIENFIMVKGDTFTFDISIPDLKNTETISNIQFSVKEKKQDQNYIFQKTFLNGIFPVDNLKYRIKIIPQDTYNLTQGQYYYNLKVILDNDIYTVLVGKITIE